MTAEILTLSPAATIESSRVEFPEGLTLTAHRYDFSRSDRYELAVKRTGSCGLEITRTYCEDHQPDGKITRSIHDRTETFCAEVAATYTAGNRIGKGTRVYLWRCETLDSDYSSPAPGEVTYHGFASHGRQSIGAHGDAEAKARFTTVREDNGSVRSAESEPTYKAAAKTYDQMMSS